MLRRAIQLHKINPLPHIFFYYVNAKSKNVLKFEDKGEGFNTTYLNVSLLKSSNATTFRYIIFSNPIYYSYFKN